MYVLPPLHWHRARKGVYELTTYIIKRLFTVPIVLIGVTLIVFLSIRLVPGDAAQMMLGERGTPQQLEQLRHQLGLDQPVPIQYWHFLMNAVRGDFGKSIQTERPVMEDIRRSFSVTIQLAAVALILSVLISIPAGVISAVKQYSLLDNIVMVLVLLGMSMPVFWTGILLMIYIGMPASLPLSGFLDPQIALQHITGIQIIDALLTWNVPAIKDLVRHLLMPGTALATISTAVIARMTRSSMLEVLKEDYVRTARAKGLGELSVIFKHALKNALIPVVTVVGLQFGVLLSGAVLTETVFSIPGMGRLAVTSLLYRDFPVIQAVVLIIAIVFVVVNLAVDLTYTWLDPKIRYG